ncbi:transposase family protein [Streptomyces sp. NPDC052012]|uniref:transposase family protein n=1 Tax=Streptomyces sp. NPDC052012 TaxID=3155051 RepID=UPI003450C2F7
MLGRIPDPAGSGARRYRLGSLLALCLVAVLGGATSPAAVGRFAADTDYDLREQLGLTSNAPNASTLERLLARLILQCGFVIGGSVSASSYGAVHGV